MKYRAVCVGPNEWRIQWRIAYFIRGWEWDFTQEPLLAPRGPIWPYFVRPTQAEAEARIYEILKEEEALRRARRVKGPWLPEAYY